MIITLERTGSGPFIVKCGHDRTEHRELESALQQIACFANEDKELNAFVNIVWDPTSYAATTTT